MEGLDVTILRFSLLVTVIKAIWLGFRAIVVVADNTFCLHSCNEAGAITSQVATVIAFGAVIAASRYGRIKELTVELQAAAADSTVAA
jgi:hypothetical protein